MSLADDIRAVLPELRAANASLLIDLGQIARPGPTGFDTTTGLLDPSETVVYTGPCRLRQPSGIVENEAVFGDRQVTASRFIACFAHDLTGVRIDDVVRLLESDDVDILGRRFRIIAIPMSSWSLYKGFACELVE